MSNFIITSDLHLTSNPLDAYRFELFRFLKEQCQEHSVAYVFILGDLTDLKDNHSAKLVTKIVRSLTDLSKHAKVIILKGNHDYIDADEPFFGFLNKIENVKFVITPKRCMSIGGKNFMFLPHAREPLKEWEHMAIDKTKGIDYIMMHQTMDGSVASNGYALKGLNTSIFKKSKSLIFSGDIHVPQSIGKVRYVGSPYHVHYGDSFKPRLLLVSGTTQRDLYFPCLHKHSVRISHPDKLKSWVEANDVRPFDQVKVRLSLGREEYANWQKYKQQIIMTCGYINVHLHSVELEPRSGSAKKNKKLQGSMNFISDPNDVLKKFCKRQKTSTYNKTMGEKLIND